MTEQSDSSLQATASDQRPCWSGVAIEILTPDMVQEAAYLQDQQSKRAHEQKMFELRELERDHARKMLDLQRQQQRDLAELAYRADRLAIIVAGGLGALTTAAVVFALYKKILGINEAISLVLVTFVMAPAGLRGVAGFLGVKPPAF